MLRILKCKDCRFIDISSRECTNDKSPYHGETIDVENEFCKYFHHNSSTKKEFKKTTIKYPVYVLYVDDLGNSKAMILADMSFDDCKTENEKDAKVKEIFEKMFTSKGYEYSTCQLLLPYNETELDIIFCEEVPRR